MDYFEIAKELTYLHAERLALITKYKEERKCLIEKENAPVISNTQ